MNNRFVILSLSACVALLGFQQVFSQASFDASSLIDSNTGLPVGIEEQVSIEQTPKIPKPGEIVVIRIESFMTNLNKAKITWAQDGVVSLSQIGAVTNQVQAPTSGKSSKITITINKEGGGTLVRTITLSPADVDLLYEAQTYAHPFFKGKRRYTSEALVTFIAVPHFVTSANRKIPDNELVYTWKVNGSVQQLASGYGKNTFSTIGQLIERPVQITVDVSAVNSNLVATQSLNLRTIAPEVLLYENNPLLGVVYEKAVLGKFFLERPQVDFEAIPYFFSSPTKDSNSFTYKWAINGVGVTNKLPMENYLLLQNDKNEEGRAFISASVTHNDKILQTTNTQFELEFKKITNLANEEFTF